MGSRTRWAVPSPGLLSILPGFTVAHFSLGNWPSGSSFSTQKCAFTHSNGPVQYELFLFFFLLIRIHTEMPSGNKPAPSRQALHRQTLNAVAQYQTQMSSAHARPAGAAQGQPRIQTPECSPLDILPVFSFSFLFSASVWQEIQPTEGSVG